jgi:hypothetical protein
MACEPNFHYYFEINMYTYSKQEFPCVPSIFFDGITQAQRKNINYLVDFVNSWRKQTNPTDFYSFLVIF